MMIQQVFVLAKKTIKTLWQLAGIYILWIILHYIASWLYSYWCTPWGIAGFIITPFIINSPHCTALRWCIVHGAETLTAMWIIMGSWLVTKLVTSQDN